MPLSALVKEGFSIHPAYDGGALRLSIRGYADADVQPVLEPYFSQVHAEAQTENMSEVVVDVHELVFINSSGFKALVGWLGQLNTLAPQRQYRIRFVRNAGQRWQVRSFDALQRMSCGLVSIEDWDGKAA